MQYACKGADVAQVGKSQIINFPSGILPACFRNVSGIPSGISSGNHAPAKFLPNSFQIPSKFLPDSFRNVSGNVSGSEKCFQIVSGIPSKMFPGQNSFQIPSGMFPGCFRECFRIRKMFPNSFRIPSRILTFLYTGVQKFQNSDISLHWCTEMSEF